MFIRNITLRVIQSGGAKTSQDLAIIASGGNGFGPAISNMGLT
jgi:hypothetical protein